MAISFDSGNDKESGTAVAETLNGLGGNDTITALGGNDTIAGGTGNDLLDGGVGNDKLKGDAGKDKLLGGVGNDLIEGGVDNDVLDGGNGNDTLNGGTGKDTMTGGEGNDTYIVDNVGDKVTDVTTGTKGGIDLVSSSISYVLGAEIENLTLTGESDLNGTGNKLANEINGNAGSNKLNGAAGNDTINGNEGDDTIDGGAGVDKLAGGDGSDVYVVSNNEDRITETAVDGDDDEVQSSAPDYELGANIERLTLLAKGEDGIGNELDNTLDGNALDNELNGDAGNDTINGNGGDDILDGGEGDDEINGGDGYDVAVYLGSQDDYKWYSDEEGWIVEDTTGVDGEDGVDEGIDTLTGIEALSFSGGEEEVVIGEEEPEPPVEPELPVLQVNATELMIDESGKTARITVTLSEASDELVTVQYAATAETATAGSDYKILGTGTLKFLPGKTSQTISTSIVNDTLDEVDETFSVQLTNPLNATLDTNASTVVTIIDNDEPALPEPEPESVTLQVTTTRVTSTEGDPAVITVTLSAPSTQTVTVDYATKDGSAKNINGDYIATTGSLTFAPNETSQTIILETLDDTAVEQNETFLVQLSNPVNATLATVTKATVTILDDTQQCVGTEADDNLTCSAEDNDIDALAGNDVVNGMGGNDTLIGNTGNDTLAGGDGNDQLLGGEGDDVLQDSNGNDNMSGGLGDDRFMV
ncbi:calcium-binding protein, partial [Chromatium okenii]|uniref:calcium-binding protein n=1 Tax=Chromatium okenii TaxID=61644 RepID=UPI0026F2C5AF